MIRPATLIWTLLIAANSALAGQPPVRIVGSQPAFLDIARQIGGASVVTAPLDADSIAGRDSVIVVEGGSFDAWARPLIGKQRNGSIVLRAGKPDESGGFSWYDLDAMRRLARTLAKELTRRRADEALAFSNNLGRFEASLEDLGRKVQDVSRSYRGSKVLLTDDRFRPLLNALDLRPISIGGEKTGTSMTIARAMREHTGVILVYDSETKAGMSDLLKSQADENGLPMVGLRETMPSALRYQQWIARSINTIQGALNEAAP